MHLGIFQNKIISFTKNISDAKSPSFGSGTLVGVGIGTESDSGWSAQIKETTDNSIVLSVRR